MIVSLLFQYVLIDRQEGQHHFPIYFFFYSVKNIGHFIFFTVVIFFVLLHLIAFPVFAMNRNMPSSSLDEVPCYVGFYGNPQHNRGIITDVQDGIQYEPMEDWSTCYQDTFCGFFKGMGLGSIIGAAIGAVGSGLIGDTAFVGASAGAAFGAGLGSIIGAACGWGVNSCTFGNNSCLSREVRRLEEVVVTSQPAPQPALFQEVYDETNRGDIGSTHSSSSNGTSGCLSVISGPYNNNNNNFIKYLQLYWSDGTSSEEEEVLPQNRGSKASQNQNSSFKNKGGDSSTNEDQQQRSGNVGVNQINRGAHSGRGNSTLVLERETCFFTPGYSHEGQVCSLLGLQGALLGSSESILHTLRLLTLQVSKNIVKRSLEIDGRSKGHIVQAPSSTAQTSSFIQNLFSSHHFFVFTGKYESNLEHKDRSAQLGLTITSIPYTQVGLMYHRKNKNVAFSKEIQLGSACGSVKAKEKTEGFAASICLNPNKVGFTGQLASYYGWGNVKSHRVISNAGRELEAKGSPNIYLSGGLVQLGYNLPVASQWLLLPYVEHVFSVARWNEHKEVSSPLPCSISKNEEQLWENSIGLRSYWKIVNTSQLQMWTAYTIGRCKIAGLTSKFFSAPIKEYEISVPGLYRKYTQVEIGASHQTKITDMLTVCLDGTVKFEKQKKLGNSQVAFSVAYHY